MRTGWASVCAAAVSGVVVLGLVVACAASALPEVAFADAERVASVMDHQPGRVAALLTEILTQDQVDVLESRLFPEPTAAEKVAGLGKVKCELGRLGFSETDALVEAVSSRIEELGGDGDEVTR